MESLQYGELEVRDSFFVFVFISVGPSWSVTLVEVDSPAVCVFCGEYSRTKHLFNEKFQI